MPAREKRKEAQIREMFKVLFQKWGQQHWWPAESAFEMIAGAFLTQNTAWTNVERALANLRTANVLSLEGIRRIPLGDLELLLRPAGYYRQKAHRLKVFVGYLDERYGGSLEAMFARPTRELRVELLNLHGIGPETADSILLYAAQHEIFVVDAYTRRIFERHGIVSATAKYDEIRELAERALTDGSSQKVLGEEDRVELRVEHKPPGAHHAPSLMSNASRSELAQMYNEMHGLLVGVAKNYCHARVALCEQCPLAPLLPKPRKTSKITIAGDR